MMTIEEFAIKAVGVPFVQHGREWGAWDCWGLIYVAYKELFDIELPRYENDYDVVKQKDEIAKLYQKGRKEDWVPVKTGEQEAGDGVMLFTYGRDCHVGLMISKDKFLHVEHGTETCVQRLTDQHFRIEGIYRHVKRLNGTG